MPPFGSISRTDLIACLRSLGFEGPYSGKKHAMHRAIYELLEDETVDVNSANAEKVSKRKVASDRP